MALRKEARGDPQARDPRVWQLLQQGMMHQQQRRLPQAMQCYRAVLEMQPEQPDALHLLGLIAAENAQYEQAAGFLRRAVKGKPDDPVLRRQYGEALLAKSEREAAERELRKSLRLNPGDLETLCTLANCHAAAGQNDEAEALYKRILAEQPANASALQGYAHLCIDLGRMAEARELFRTAIRLNANPALAYGGLAECEEFQEDPPELAEIRRLLATPGLPRRETLSLCQAGLKICDSVGRYDEAFEFGLVGSRLNGRKFDLDTLRRRYDGLKRVFTTDYFDRHSGAGDTSQRPVFVIGMPRSGTTLTEQIIARHPQAAGAGELMNIGRFVSSLGSDTGEQTRRLNALRDKEIRAAARDYLSVLKGIGGGAKRVVDKNPLNFQHLGVIATLFPKSHIIHCRRSPLDTCVSCFMTQFGDKHAYSTDLETLGGYYREYSTLMEYWRDVLPLTIHEVAYENLVTDLEGEARKLIDFIGLEWDPACLRFYEGEGAIHTPSRAQVRQPIYSNSVGRWRRYEKHLAPLRKGSPRPRRSGVRLRRLKPCGRHESLTTNYSQ